MIERVQKFDAEEYGTRSITHGATVGQLDEDQLFYLKTRGFLEKAAKELLTKSFAESLIQTIEFPGVMEYLENNLLKKLEA